MLSPSDIKTDTSRAIVTNQCGHGSMLNAVNEQPGSEGADREPRFYSGGFKGDPLAHQSNVSQMWTEKKERMQLSLQPRHALM